MQASVVVENHQNNFKTLNVEKDDKNLKLNRKVSFSHKVVQASYKVKNSFNLP